MKYAQQLKQSNVVTYLLYMWYVEDLLRAHDGHAERLRPMLEAQYTPEELPQAEEWYANLCEMMRAEGVTQRGHLQILRNVVMDLTELHEALLASPRFPFYRAAYYNALPLIVELRQKNGHKEEPELETCLEAFYGNYLLRMQQKPVSEATTQALKTISTFLSLLTEYYHKERRGELDRYKLDDAPQAAAQPLREQNPTPEDK